MTPARPVNELQAYSSSDRMNADLIMAFLDDFARQITPKTVGVLDNAPIHHSDEFQDKIPQWAQQDWHLFYLPTYRPHLNLIETLWRKINGVARQYEWLKPQHYQSCNTLGQAVEDMLLQVGSSLKIDFSELKQFTQFKTSFIFT